MLLVTTVVTMVLIFGLFEQQGKWWFGTVVTDLYSPTNTATWAADSGGNLIYLLAALATIAVGIGITLLKQHEQPSGPAIVRNEPVMTVNSSVVDMINQALNNVYNEQATPCNLNTCGLAEAVRMAASFDELFFKWLEEHANLLNLKDEETLQCALARSNQLQLSRKGLGQNDQKLEADRWHEHKIEVLGVCQINPEQAEAISLALDTRYAVNIGLLGESEAMRIIQLLEKLGFSLWYQQLEDKDSHGHPMIVQGLADISKDTPIILTSTMGSQKQIDGLNANTLAKSLEWLKRRYIARALSDFQVNTVTV